MAKARILVIEDNEDNLELVSFLLGQDGYEVIQAKDGRQGLDLVLSERPDMILLDMSIPEVDGWKVARQLRDDPQTQSICIVALTGHTAPGDRKRAFDAGCNGYISKPLDIPNFTNEVTTYLVKYRSED